MGKLQLVGWQVSLFSQQNREFAYVYKVRVQSGCMQAICICVFFLGSGKLVF